MKSYLTISIIIGELAYKPNHEDFIYCLIKLPSLRLESNYINDKIIYHIFKISIFFFDCV